MPSISADEALARYTTSEAFSINKGLRDGAAPGEVAQALDKAFATASLPKATKVRRVISLGAKYEMVDAIESKKTIVNPGYSSAQVTTYGDAASQVEDFAPGVPKGKVAVMEFTVPKGFPAIDVGTPEGGLGFDQGEILLPRGTGYKVTGSYIATDNTVMLQVTLVPPPALPEVIDTPSASTHPYELTRADPMPVADRIGFKPSAPGYEDSMSGYAAWVRSWMQEASQGGVVINADPASLAGILRDGRMKNAHEVGRGGAAYLAERTDYENELLGLPQGMGPSSKPIYGWGARASQANTDWYGELEIHLKPEVSSRTTWSVGDSIVDSTRPLWTSEIDSATPDDLFGASTTAGLTDAALVKGRRDFERRFQAMYVEAQVHGGVGLKDVGWIGVSTKAAIKRIPPETRQALKDAGIEIRLVNQMARM